ncbi:MAG TPA: nickel-responsive transcriptional regulator NikR [Stellaceae bacterium]|nr:nickel-responsive transcriptional regulator NikR [Stellaceae bacterium]
MQRITIVLDDELIAEVDRMISARGYQNRSEAIRDLARAGLQQMSEETASSRDCVAALVYVYDHESRDLSKRLTRLFHDHHDLSLAAMHVHLDHESCMEVTVLQGKTKDVRQLGDHVIAERGVRHGRLVTVPVALESRTHAHGPEAGHRHLHTHVREG